MWILLCSTSDAYLAPVSEREMREIVCFNFFTGWCAWLTNGDRFTSFSLFAVGVLVPAFGSRFNSSTRIQRILAGVSEQGSYAISLVVT